MSDMDVKVLDEVKREIALIGEDRKKLDESFRRDLEAARSLAAEGREYADAAVKAHAESAVAKFEALQKQLDEKASDLQRKLDNNVDDLKVALNRRGMVGAGAEDDVKFRGAALEFKRHRAAVRGDLRPSQGFVISDEELAEIKSYEAAFGNTLLRRDEKRWTDSEAKALSTGEDPTGGWLVPPALSNRIISRIWETSPMRSLATVEQIGTDRLEIPIDDDEVGMGWVGEEETRPETTTPRLGTQTLLLAEQYAKPKVTQRLLEDAAMDLEGWLARKVAEKFARAEATAFITGNGVKKPRGILAYPAGTGRGYVTQVTSGNATALTPDSIIGLPFYVQEPYLGNARFLMKRSALAAIALFKNSQNDYIWSDGLRGAAGMALAGYPVAFADDMPAVAAGSLSVAFGDFREAYTIVDRLGITTLRDPYSSKPYVEYYTRRRLGGDVVNSYAYVILKTAA